MAATYLVLTSPRTCCSFGPLFVEDALAQLPLPVPLRRANGSLQNGLRSFFADGSCHALRARASGTRKKISSYHLAAATPLSIAQRPAVELVDELLELIQGTDRGASADEETKKKVAAIIEDLEAQCMEEPLQSPLIFGEWDVGYSGSNTATGGYYRSILGRALLQTEEMVQTVAEPNRAGNRVVFKALASVPGKVSLEGVFKPLDNKWIEVTFEPAQLELGPWSFSYGKESQVRLATIYLDERIRVGRGSRGSLFVFIRRSS